MSADPPAVTVHGFDDACAALRGTLAAQNPVWLLPAPRAAALLGPGWWVAMIDAARAAVPGAEARAAFPCGACAGTAQAALAAGCEAIVFTGDDDVAARLASIAHARGARVLRQLPAPDGTPSGSAR